MHHEYDRGPCPFPMNHMPYCAREKPMKDISNDAKAATEVIVKALLGIKEADFPAPLRYQVDCLIENVREDAIKQARIDALRHAAELCRKADISRNPDMRITCWKVLREEADKLTTP